MGKSRSVAVPRAAIVLVLLVLAKSRASVSTDTVTDQKSRTYKFGRSLITE